MSSFPDDAAALLACLESCTESRNFYHRFSSFLQPFGDFIFLDDYNPRTVKKNAGLKKNSKVVPTKENIRPIAREFHPFLSKAIKLLLDLLKRSPPKGAEREEKMQVERATELLGIYRLTVHCLLCIAPCLTGQPYLVHLQWGQLVRRLEIWNKYNDAKEEGFALLESLCTLLVTPHLKSAKLSLPDPSVIGSAGTDIQLAYLLSEMVTVLAYCAFNSQTRDSEDFQRLLELIHQVQPWFCIMEPHAYASRHTILVDAFYRCALFLVEESKFFDDDLVHCFCLTMLKECIKSPSVDRFPVMAHRICSTIGLQWHRRSCLVTDVLRMSMEWSYNGGEVDIAKYVNALLGLISSCAEGFNLTGKDTYIDGSGLSHEAEDYLEQVSIALELCCKSICKYVQLLCQPQLKNSKCCQEYDNSSDLIKDVIGNAFKKCARIIDIFYKLGATNVSEVTINTIFELSVVEVSFPKLSLSFPLVKQWAKMLCKDFKDDKVDGAPSLHTLLRCRCPTWPKTTIGEVLEQELLAYDQLESWNPLLCQRMETKVIDSLLMDVWNARDFILQRARVLVRKTLVLRSREMKISSSCFDVLTEAISLLKNVAYDSFEENTLRCHHLAFSYLIRAQFTQEAKQDWEAITCDIQHAINLMSKLEFEPLRTLNGQLKPSAKCTIAMLLYTVDLLSLKGLLTFHLDIYTLINLFCKLENLSIDKGLNMFWAGRRLSHSFCTFPIDPSLFLRMSQLDNKLNSITFWTNCMKSPPYLLFMFAQKFFLSDSILDEENVQRIEDFYNCKMAVEDVKMVVSSLLLNVSAKSEMFSFAAQIYYDLAERVFAAGRVLEALSYAKEALVLRYKVLRKQFALPTKKPEEPVKSSIETKGELDNFNLELLGSAFTEVWRDVTNLSIITLSPWSILRCYLESILQVGTLHEATGDGAQSEKLFLTGKRFSLLQSLPYCQIAFTSALGQLYRKKLLWELAENELNIATKLLRENDTMISCNHCKLILEVSIDMEIDDLSLKCLDRGSQDKSHTLDIYRSVIEKLSNDKVGNSSIDFLKQVSIDESIRCHLEDTQHLVLNTIKSHPWENGGKSLVCNICSFLKHNFISENVGMSSSAREMVQVSGIECGELQMQLETMKKSRNDLKKLPKLGNGKNELKPRRSSRNQSSLNKHASISTDDKNYNNDLNCSFDADVFSHKTLHVQESDTSFNSSCSNRIRSSSVECLRCLFVKLIKDGTMHNIIFFKWQCQRRRLLLRALLKRANSLEAFGVKPEPHEIHGVFWRCISVLFDGYQCFDIGSHGKDLSLFEVIGNSNIGDIFTLERGDLLHSMCWFFLKDIHPEDASVKCCSLSNVQMLTIISWLLRAFILFRETPILYQKVSRLIASLILLSTLDGSIPQPICSQQSLSISHWAAFFHQASIGSVVNNQYLSFASDKTCNFKACKGLESEIAMERGTEVNCISRFAPDKLEHLGEFVEEFYHNLPKVSVICISLFGNEYANLVGEVLVLPSFFPAWLLITRFDFNNQPIIIFLPADSISEGILPFTDQCEEFMCESKSPVSDWLCPWSRSVIDDVSPLYRHILEVNFASLSNGGAEAHLNYAKWWSCRKNLDNQLDSLLRAIEDEWIGSWGCLLLGERLDFECYEKLVVKLSKCLNSQCSFEVNANLIRVILSGSQSVVAAETCISQSILYKGLFGRGGCCREQRFRAFADCSKEIETILASVRSLLEVVSEENSIARSPVVLVLDKDVQMLPWENLPILKNQEVYRMPSLQSIMLKLSQPHYGSEKGCTSEVYFPHIDPFHTYYILNPSGDLDYTQQQFEAWFQNHKWEGKAGNVPTIEELQLALQNHDLFVYLGHGSGMQYIRADSFGKLDRCAAAFLMGCSSGALRQSGSYAPLGAPLCYLFAGSPSVIANLWEVTDKDIDRFAMSMLNAWTQDSSPGCTKCRKAVLPSRRKVKRKEVAETENCRYCEDKCRVASFISQARGACKLPTLIGAAAVCYGVPTILKRKQ